MLPLRTPLWYRSNTSGGVDAAMVTSGRSGGCWWCRSRGPAPPAMPEPGGTRAAFSVNHRRHACVGWFVAGTASVGRPGTSTSERPGDRHLGRLHGSVRCRLDIGRERAGVAHHRRPRTHCDGRRRRAYYDGFRRCSERSTGGTGGAPHVHSTFTSNIVAAIVATTVADASASEILRLACMFFTPID